MTTPAYAGIICPTHGKVDINRTEYSLQMSRPDSLWVCPICRRESQFDDDRYEALHIPDVED